jgi:hypothetical protein
MLTENTVSTLLTASITGAGLVLAVYALIIPLSRKYFSYRAEEIYEEIGELKDRIKETDSRISSEELGELKGMVESIEERQAIPAYMGLGAGLTFFGYIIATFLSFFWLIDYNKPAMESWLPFTFFISTLFFLLLGVYSIKDINKTMKKEYEDLKQKVEEAKAKPKGVSIELRRSS